MGAKTHEVLTHDTKSHYAWLVWCPACDEPHSFDERWTFDGNHDAPTFRASMLVYGWTSSDHRHHHPRCHSFLTAGIWEYCGDSEHSMKGQRVAAPDWASTRFGRMRADGVVPSEDP